MNQLLIRRARRRAGIKDLRGIAFTVFTDFGLQLSLIFLMALVARQKAAELRFATELPIDLPGLGSEPEAEPDAEPLVIEWDGEQVAVAGQTLGPPTPATLAQVRDRALGLENGRKVVLRIPDGPYTQLRQALGDREVTLQVR